MEGCYNCTQTAIENNAKRNEIVQQAQQLANKTGEWVVIYTDPATHQKAIAIAGTGNYPAEELVSPKLQNLTV